MKTVKSFISGVALEWSTMIQTRRGKTAHEVKYIAVSSSGMGSRLFSSVWFLYLPHWAVLFLTYMADTVASEKLLVFRK